MYCVCNNLLCLLAMVEEYQEVCVIVTFGRLSGIWGWSTTLLRDIPLLVQWHFPPGCTYVYTAVYSSTLAPLRHWVLTLHSRLCCVLLPSLIPLAPCKTYPFLPLPASPPPLYPLLIPTVLASFPSLHPLLTSPSSPLPSQCTIPYHAFLHHRYGPRH